MATTPRRYCTLKRVNMLNVCCKGKRALVIEIYGNGWLAIKTRTCCHNVERRAVVIHRIKKGGSHGKPI